MEAQVIRTMHLQAVRASANALVAALDTLPDGQEKKDAKRSAFGIVKVLNDLIIDAEGRLTS